MVFAGILFKFWVKSTQLFTHKFPHTQISVNLFGNGDCICLNLTTTSKRLESLSILTTPDIILLPRITTLFLTIYFRWEGIYLSTDDDIELFMLHAHILKLYKFIKVTAILSGLSEIQLMASHMDEYKNLHLWHITPKNQLQLSPSQIDDMSDTAHSLSPEAPQCH